MTRQLTAPTPKVRRLNIVAPIAKGGTGADNTADAATQLGGINSATIGLAGGPAKVQAGGTVDTANYPAAFPKGPTLDGPADFYVSAVHTLTISNYDVASDASYTVAASAGTISRTGATITYTAPATIQTVTLTIGGRVLTVNIKATAPIQPTIQSPVSGSINQSERITVIASAFQLPTGTPSHQFSDWEVATDSAFNNVFASSFNDAVNKTSWQVGGFAVSTTYYLRVRYKDTTQGYSSWSPTVSFVTKANFTVSNEEAKITASDKAANDAFGGATIGGYYTNAVALSSDGSRMVVGVPNKTYNPSGANYSQSGAVYVFVRNTTTNTWSQEVKFANGTGDAGGATVVSISTADITDLLGGSVSIDSTGTRIAMGSTGDETTAPLTDVGSCGTVYVAVRSGTTWTVEQRIYAADRAATDYFGYAVSLDSTGTRIAIGSWQADVGGTTNAGAVYIWLRTGSTWAQEQKINAADKATDDGFASSVALNSDATRVAVGCYNSDIGANSNAGAMYIFTRVGVTWTQEQKLSASTPVTAGLAGMSVSIDSTGTRAVMGAPANGSSTPGQAIVFTRNTTTNVWTQEAVLTATDVLNNNYFGTSVSMNASGTIIAVGCPRATSTASQAGGVYIFTRSGATWTQTSKLITSDKAATDWFGISCAISADSGRIAGAASQADVGLTNCGAVYVYS